MQFRLLAASTTLLSLVLVLTGCTDEEKASYREAVGTNAPSGYRAFLNAYPESRYSGDVQDRLQDADFSRACQDNTISSYAAFLEAYPGSAHEQEARQGLERCSFEKAREKGRVDSYRNFLLEFPLSTQGQRVREEVRRICSAGNLDIGTVTSCRQTMKLFPYSGEDAELLRRINALEEALKSDRVGYEKFLVTSSAYSAFQHAPLEKDDSPADEASSLSAAEILEKANDHYLAHGTVTEHVNPRLERLYRFALTYDLISRLRFSRGVDNLPGQCDIPKIMKEIMGTRWFREYVVKITEREEYGFREDYPLRLVAAIHTAAHFFELPYPTLLCLLFQESKFDFSVVSRVGAVGLGQLTPIAVKQVAKLRRKRHYEDRLQAATAHLKKVYSDPVFLQILDRMDLQHNFPTLPPRFPAAAAVVFPRNDRTSVVRQVAAELGKQGFPYAADIALVENKCRLLSRGMVLPERYAAVHGVYRDVMERNYGQHLGNLYNPETNVLYAAMILRYYLKYRWYVSGREVDLKPLVRTMAAIVSYNQGQAGVRKYLRKVAHEFPDVALDEVSLAQCNRLFTRERLQLYHPDSPTTVSEVFRHATRIGSCSCLMPEQVI